jgi:tyrosyl-tRNA synthetase
MIFDDLQERGLIRQATHPERIKTLLDNGSARFYLGVDPTSDSLHVGHLLPIILASRLALAGHTPVIVIGGATAAIGDPSGKSDMRQMLSREQIALNSSEIENQIRGFLGGSAIFKSNLEWFGGLNLLDFLRDTAPHFSVNTMLNAECFKRRLESSGQGLSFLELNYMLLQAGDFLHLNSSLDCVLQIGGDDQWSNILAGIDLIHKKTGKQALAFTLPLLTDSNGVKMGKTEKGAVWLSSKKTSVFDFFQFWRNLPDELVSQCLLMFTFISVDRIREMRMVEAGEINGAKRMLATEMTRFVHGEEATVKVLSEVDAMFGGDKNDLPAIPMNDRLPIIDLLLNCNLVESKGEARRLIAGNGISINGVVVENHDMIVAIEHLGADILLRKGKKHLVKIRLIA